MADTFPGPNAALATSRDILVVDDNPRNLLAIEAALGDLGRRLVTADSGREALRKLLSQDFAIILLDVLMPAMDGFETARLIRARERTRHVPIIFITAFEQSAAQVLEGYELGAVDFLFKPIIPAMLRAKVSVFVALQERTAEVARQAELLQAAERRRWQAEALRSQAEEQRKNAEQLERLNASLKEADRRKDEFLAMLAHELRNPLAPLHTSLELLRREGGRADLERLHAIMSRQLRQLTRLVDDLLDVSRITTGAIELRKEHTELADIMAQAVETSAPLIEERGHELVVTKPSEPLPVVADPVRLAQVISNLLNNAARYTDEHGRIDLQCERDGSDVVIRVVDTGRGIPEELQRRVFEPFVQEGPALGGLGIGLTLVRRLVELHGGEVTVHSEGRGQGATFLIRLPLDKAARKEDEHPSAPPPSAVANRPLRVIVVEDSVDIRESLGELLELWGHEVSLASTGPEGLGLVVEQSPDVAIVDIGLPGFDGYALARRVREAGMKRPPRLIALTGFGQRGDRERALAAGFDEHVVKPPDPERLRLMLGSEECRAH